MLNVFLEINPSIIWHNGTDKKADRLRAKILMSQTSLFEFFNCCYCYYDDESLFLILKVKGSNRAKLNSKMLTRHDMRLLCPILSRHSEVHHQNRTIMSNFSIKGSGKWSVCLHFTISTRSDWEKREQMIQCRVHRLYWVT